MERNNLIAKAEVTIEAPVDNVWEALINPEKINKYMFGTKVTSDWKEGSEIIWEGEWQGNHYKDKGRILKLISNKRLQYSHFIPQPGVEDNPENYHTVTIDLNEKGKQTQITLTQDNNATEEARQHSQKNCEGMLSSLKKLMEENV